MMRFLLSSVLIALSLLTGSSTSIADEAGKVYELRTYHTFPGRLDALHKRFREHTIDIFKKHEMTSVGYWTPMDEKDGKGNTLVYLLSFPSREAARASWKAFGQDPEWKKVQAESEKDGKIVERVESVFLDPAGFGPTPSPGGSADSPRVFELRTYLASPGKLDNLFARFRDHTIDIFKSHDMTSVGYFEPMDEPRGHGTTLVYMLAFPSRDAARASWEAFRNDPEWKKAKAASEADGTPLAAKVTSVYLEPTDYSPMK